MRPLQAHCHRGLGTLYATTGQQEQARAAAVDSYRRCTGDGDDILAPRDRGGAGAGGGTLMDYHAVLVHVLALLQQEKRVAYRVLKRQFQLDDEILEDLKDDLIYAKQLAVDEDGRVLVWTGGVGALAAAAPAPLTYTPSYLAEKILTSRSALEGERKQVTVLFADLKGSTELIRDLDPEAAQHLFDPALQCMMDAVHRYEGTVNQVMGDGIMALFGAPVAHEDHAVRACYAALAMQAALRRYAEEVRRSHGLEMQARVGLNSGEVVVRSIGNDLHMDYSAVGQTTHLAARMEQLATPGSVRLTAATLRLAEGLVQVNALGPVPGQGVARARGGLRAGGGQCSPGAFTGRGGAGTDPLRGAAAGAAGPAAGARAGGGGTWPGGGVGGGSRRREISHRLRVSSTPTTRQGGRSWRALRCPMARPHPISP